MRTPTTDPKTQRTLSLPPEFEAAIRERLAPLGYSVEKPGALSQAILKLSDFYVAEPDGQTPWEDTWAQAASLAYYFPLNLARNLAVAREGERMGFFDGLENLVDFGSGAGPAFFAFTGETRDGIFKNRFALDISPGALRMGRELALAAGLAPEELAREIDVNDANVKPKQLSVNPARTLLVSSYALTELEKIPAWWLENEALALIEPSTRDDGRKLMSLRAELIAAGYHVWAPCTHQLDCPLLVNSEKDWCHDRIHWQASPWMKSIEQTLPMKNATLTYSYLLARRSKPAPAQVAASARLVGDTLIEKGKTRQAVCRGPEREFLAWFPQRMKKEESIALERGNLVRLAEGLEKKSTEIRLPSPSSIEEILPTAQLSDSQ